MKLATYSTSDDATPKVGLVRDKELVPLADKGVEGGMTSLLQAGIDINAHRGSDKRESRDYLYPP